MVIVLCPESEQAPFQKKKSFFGAQRESDEKPSMVVNKGVYQAQSGICRDRVSDNDAWGRVFVCMGVAHVTARVCAEQQQLDERLVAGVAAVLCRVQRVAMDRY
jgi:hypothetical protein